MPTPHISAPDGAFAETVLMPGDPHRAAHIADTWLDGVEMVTDVRGMSGFTGTFEGTRVSTMASGMGMPSAAIYITELVRSYGVKRIIRVGTAGVYDPDLALRQIVAADRVVTNSAVPDLLGASDRLTASPGLLETATRTAAANDIEIVTGTILSSDLFYEPDDSSRLAHTANGVLCVEMEAAALYAICALEGAEALTLLTMTDHLASGERLTSAERELSVDEMLELGLRTAVAQH